MSDDAARQIASELRRRGLAAPAQLLADAHRPLAPLLTDVAIFLQPFAGALGGRLGAWIHEAAEGERAVDGLIERLGEPVPAGDDDAESR